MRRLLPALVAASLAAPLAAQIITMGSASEPKELATFLARLSTDRPTLVVLDTPKAGWGTTFRALFRKDPLVEYFPQQGFRVLAAGEGIGAQLAAREGWEAVPRWLLIDGHGRIHAESRECPTAEILTTALRDAGWRPPLEALEKALAQRPDHLGFQQDRLRRLLELAEVRTRARLELPDPKEERGSRMSIMDGEGFDFSNQPASQDPFQGRTVQDLSSTEDAALWGPFAEALTRYVAQEAWATQPNGFRYRSMNMRGFLPVATPFARVSPTCREAYTRVLEATEAALRRVPTSAALWGLWTSLSAFVDRPLEPLLASMAPSPLAEAAWPPASLRLQAMREAMAAKHWPRAESLVKDHWARLLELGSSSKEDQSLLTSTQWDRIGSPYLEILLRQDRVSDAEALLDAWERHQGWKGVRSRAESLARSLGQTTLAERWKR